jgi:hypothetical protein
MERITTSTPPGAPGSVGEPPSGNQSTKPTRDPFAEALRGFGPLGIAAILVILLTGNVTVGGMATLPVGATLVLVWAWRSGTPWREIGYVRPRSWPATVAGGILFGGTLKLLMKAVVMPLLGADPINRAYHFLAGNAGLLPSAVWAMLVAGYAEETLFRGYAFERLGRLLGRGAVARTAIVLVTSLWFGSVHYPSQGLAGAKQATITGLVWGTVFAVTGRLPLLMIAHAAFDLTALALIYWNLESRVAHWVFR